MRKLHLDLFSACSSLLAKIRNHFTIFFFFFSDTAPTEIYPLPPHAPLPIYRPFPEARRPHGRARRRASTGRVHSATARGQRWRSPVSSSAIDWEGPRCARPRAASRPAPASRDRKSTRLNSSHLVISYAVFCL